MKNKWVLAVASAGCLIPIIAAGVVLALVALWFVFVLLPAPPR